MSGQDEVDYGVLFRNIRPRVHKVQKADVERFLRRHHPQLAKYRIPDGLWAELVNGGFVDDCNAGLFPLDRLVNVLRGKARRKMERRQALMAEAKWTW